MEFRIDIRRMVQSVVMEEVNNLGIRTVVREKLEEVGDLTKDKIRDLVSEITDSYIRSVDINKIINNKIDTLIEQRVHHEIDEALQNYINRDIFGNKISKVLQDLILDDLKNQFYEKYRLEVINTKEKE